MASNDVTRSKRRGHDQGQSQGQGQTGQVLAKYKKTTEELHQLYQRVLIMEEAETLALVNQTWTALNLELDQDESRTDATCKIHHSVLNARAIEMLQMMGCTIKNGHASSLSPDYRVILSREGKKKSATQPAL